MTRKKSKSGGAAKGRVRKGSGSGAGYVLAEARDKRAWDSRDSPAPKETETRLGPGGFGAAYVPREKRDSALEDEPDTDEAAERSRKAE